MFFIFGRSPGLFSPSLVARRCGLYSLLLTAGVLLAGNAAAQHAIPLTLAEAEDLALDDEPGTNALLARSSALEEDAVAAGRLPDPALRFGVLNFPIGNGGFSTEAMTQAQLGIRQVFPRARSRALGTRQLQALATAMSDRSVARSRDVLVAARIAWLDTYYWQQALQTVTESRPFFADLVNVTRSMYAVGRKTQHDVLRAELELSRLDDRVIEAERSRTQAQAALSQWLGMDAYRPVARKLPAWNQLAPLEELRGELQKHPLLAAAEAGVVARQSGVELARESYKSDWALDLGYGYRDGLLPNGEPRSDFISLTVSIDLPFFGRRRQDHKLAAALQERRAALETKKELRAELRSQLDAQYARWTELTRRLLLYENEILGQSRGQAQAALLAYQSDAGDFSDVMRGYIDDLNTRLEYIRLQVARAQSYASLANLGGISR
ncbi:MAG: TolC family protein [Woeseiaceae bacterium]|nr:TolC family protein [Woeseiaceae bacterium]